MDVDDRRAGRIVMGSLDAIQEPGVKTFCSYVHRDNEGFGSVVDRLVRDVRLLYEAETGRTMDFFLDRESIGWGQNLRDAIGDSVENASFFVPIISARYFQSEWCRNELLSFYGKSKSLGVSELILPIVLAGKSLIREDSEDEVVRIVARVKYIDWTSTWQFDRGSEQWSLAVTELTQRLVELHSAVEGRLLARALRRIGRWDDPSTVDPGSPETDRPPNDEQTDTIRTQADGTLAEVDVVVQELRSFIEGLQTKLEKSVPADPLRSRIVLDQLGAGLLDRGYDLDSHARRVLESAVELDADLRSMSRSARVVGGADDIRQLHALMDELRKQAQRLNLQIREVNSLSAVLSRFGDRSIGLRAALSPVRAALQSIRDVAHILDGWGSMELPPTP